MTRPATSRASQLATHQPLGHHPHQPLPHRRRCNLGGSGQLGHPQRPRLAKQIEDANIGTFGHLIHSRTVCKRAHTIILPICTFLTTQYLKITPLRPSSQAIIRQKLTNQQPIDSLRRPNLVTGFKNGMREPSFPLMTIARKTSITANQRGKWRSTIARNSPGVEAWDTCVRNSRAPCRP